jgi:phospholipid/cholesterol/gamma-HCH transport system substrate-binding protein
VEVVPAARPGPPIAADAIVRGEDPPRFDLLVQRIYQLLEAASKLLEGDRGELGDLIRSGASLAKTLDRTIAASQDDLVRAIAGAAVAAEEGSALMRSLNHAVGDGTTVAKAVDDLGATAAVVRRELPPALDKLQRSLDQLNRLGESLDQVPPDQIAKLLKSAVSAADNAERVLADARTITERVRAGGGTIGLLLSDDEIYDDLKELLRDLKQHPWKLVWKQ